MSEHGQEELGKEQEAKKENLRPLHFEELRAKEFIENFLFCWSAATIKA